MNHIRATQSLRRACLSTPRKPQQQSSKRTYAANSPSPHPPSSPPNPNPSKPPPSRTSTYYQSFASPMFKCFLGALFTYQLAYYGWMKLEAIEEAHEMEKEIAGLRRELRDAVTRQQEQQRTVAGGGVVGEAAEKVVEGVRGTGVVVVVGKGDWWPW